jgi:hypothetical protein
VGGRPWTREESRRIHCSGPSEALGCVLTCGENRE